MRIKPYLHYIIFIGIIIFILLIPFIKNLSTYSQVLRVSDRKVISFDEMIEELKDVRIIFIGEQHDNERHHKAQLDIIEGIKGKGIPLSLGVEMFKAEDQQKLDLWAAGNLELKSFLELYYNSWGLPWSIYRNIFIFLRDNGIPLVGLNVPKEITGKVSQNGFQSLAPEDSKKLPPGITCDDIDEQYMEFIRKAYDIHEGGGKDFVYFCEAQMVWDKSMAWYLLSYMKDKPGRTMIVLSGIGHSWKRGIPEQIKRQSSYSFKVILPEVPDKVHSGDITLEDADYLLL